MIPSRIFSATIVNALLTFIDSLADVSTYTSPDFLAYSEASSNETTLLFKLLVFAVDFVSNQRNSYVRAGVETDLRDPVGHVIEAPSVCDVKNE